MTRQFPPDWIPYDGSGQPAADDVVVAVWFRDGLDSPSPTSARATEWHWGHDNAAHDIIAYLPANPEGEKK